MMNPQQAFDMEDMEGDCLTAALEEFSCMMANLSDPRRKTELCKLHMIGNNCPYGDKCNFAHGQQELKSRSFTHPNYKTVKCRNFYMEGYCCFGARCQFIHKTDASFPTNFHTNVLYARVLRLWQLKKDTPTINITDLIPETDNSEDILSRSLPGMKNYWVNVKTPPSPRSPAIESPKLRCFLDQKLPNVDLLMDARMEPALV